jgi:hypothetical protein
MFAYTLNYSIQSETYCEKVSNRDRCYNMNFVLYDVESNLDSLQILEGSANGVERGESTWLIDLWPLAVKNESLFITYKSIDPRLSGGLWGQPHEELREESYLIKFKNLILINVHVYVNRGILTGILLKSLKKISDEMKSEDFLQKITECNGCKEKINELANGEFLHRTFFSRALEHEALLHMCFEHDFKYTFLLAGGAHADYLSKYMGDLGFELRDAFGISSEKVLNLGSNLPLSLQLKMAAAFEDIFELIDKDIEIVAQSSSSSSSLSSP